MSNIDFDKNNIIAFERRLPQQGTSSDISAKPLPLKRVFVKDIELAYVDQGEGDPIVFLHGWSTSSYTWRNIIPVLANHGRCIALDFPGMGESDALKNITSRSYHFRELGEYLELFLAELGISERVTLVMQDFSTVIGCDWAYHNSQSVKAVVHNGGVFLDASSMQGNTAIIHDEYPESELQRFVLNNPNFMRDLATLGINRQMSDWELDYYVKRYQGGKESRLPVQRWLSFVPDPGVVLDSTPHIACYTSWMKYSNTPKLWLRAGSCGIATPNWETTASTFSAQTKVTLDGNYLLTEDKPFEFAQEIADWMEHL